MRRYWTPTPGASGWRELFPSRSISRRPYTDPELPGETVLGEWIKTGQRDVVHGPPGTLVSDGGHHVTEIPIEHTKPTVQATARKCSPTDEEPAQNTRARIAAVCPFHRLRRQVEPALGDDGLLVGWRAAVALTRGLPGPDWTDGRGRGRVCRDGIGRSRGRRGADGRTRREFTTVRPAEMLAAAMIQVRSLDETEGRPIPPIIIDARLGSE
jgi:hypothetical protein